MSGGAWTYTYAIATDGTQTGNEKLSNGKPLNAGSYTVTATYEDSDNLGSKTVKFTITQKELTVDVAVNNKPYDGTNTATIASAALNGVITGDNVTLTNGTPTFSSAEAANDITINFTAFSTSGDDVGNYILTQPGGVTANITEVLTPVEDSPKTGDDSNTTLWLLLGGASLTILGGMAITERKRKKYKVVKK